VFFELPEEKEGEKEEEEDNSSVISDESLDYGHQEEMPLPAVLSMARNQTAPTGSELAMYSLAFVLHPLPSGHLCLQECVNGALLATSASYVGKGAVLSATSTANALHGVLPPPPNWRDLDLHCFNISPDQSNIERVLQEVESMTKLTFSFLERKGTAALAAALADAEYGVSATGQRITAQRLEVERVLQAHMPKLFACLEELKKEKVLLKLFAAYYPLGGCMRIHKDKLFEGARLVAKLGASSNLQMQASSGDDGVAALTLSGGKAGGGVLYAGPSAGCMTMPHAVAPCSEKEGSSYSLMFDIRSTESQKTKEIVQRIVKAIEMDGSGQAPSSSSSSSSAGPSATNKPQLSGMGIKAFDADQSSKGGASAAASAFAPALCARFFAPAP